MLMTESIHVSNEKTQKSPPFIGIVGLGYVGLPVAVGFAEKYHVIGFDINKEKIHSLQNNIDENGEVSERKLAESRSEEHTSELQSRGHLVCRLLLEKKT